MYLTHLQGLCEAAFRWLTERGGPERAALVRKLGPLLPERLSGWLQRCEVRSELLAAHELAAGRHDQAARALTDLARMERTDVRRLRNAASLAKLCLAVKGQVTYSSLQISNPKIPNLILLSPLRATRSWIGCWRWRIITLWRPGGYVDGTR